MNICVKKINYFVFIIHKVNKHRVCRRWFTETNVKDFKSGALRTITNTTRSMVNWKKEFLRWCISKILFVDTEQLSKMQISLQGFFKDSVDRFGTSYIKNGFIWRCFSKFYTVSIMGPHGSHSSMFSSFLRNIQHMPDI